MTQTNDTTISAAQARAVEMLKLFGVDKPTLAQIASATTQIEANDAQLAAAKQRKAGKITCDVSKARTKGLKADGTPLTEKQAANDKGSKGGGFLIRGLQTFPYHFYKSQFNNLREHWTEVCTAFDKLDAEGLLSDRED